MASAKTAVVALGGNAITVPGMEDTIANQFSNTRRSLDGIIELIRDGYNLVVTHGNGPQVGNALLRNEMARGTAPDLPLGVLVADTQGGMGYMIEQSLRNRLKREQIKREVVTIVTQMMVHENDPAINHPTKFIGQFYTEKQARKYEQNLGWQMKQDANRGWRRVVPSPTPLSSVEGETIKQLVQQGNIVIAGGGGGIPVYIDSLGDLEGLDAVIDKDWASAVIAREVGAQVLCILTSVDQVSLHFGTDEQQDLETVTLSELKRYRDEGHFPPGSMGPKVDAAIAFMENGGEVVTITSFNLAGAALRGEAGTRIVSE
jgi:carbamate kinase